ncbi:MAG: type II and III secretion system protein [Bacteroidetes bacterium]|nr:type II and III secretion system protein [Bacteroidota bacterium]
MKKIFFVLFILLCGVVVEGTAQNLRERRMILNEYVTPEELVSMSKTLSFDKAMVLFSDFSKKFMHKIIVDNTNYAKQIGVDIENKYWLQAFEEVLRANKMWYDEREEYFQIYAVIDSTKIQKQAALETPKVPVDTTGKFLFKNRDIRISSIFLTVDVIKSLDAGINWSFLYKGDTTKVGNKTQFGGQFSSGFQDPGMVTTSSGGDIAPTAAQTPSFLGRVMPAISFSNLNLLISFFQNNQLGNVLSGPSVVVSSGKKGKIQVGQDFYVTSRDFSGNTIQEKQSAGIIIDVTPTYYEEQGIKFISLNINAERSTISAGPIINKSSAQTFSTLFDGEETVIGGLYTSGETTERGGVPILKDLPWWVLGLRYIFGYDRSSTSTQELIILLKAELVPTIEERVADIQRRNSNLIELERAKHAKEIEKYKQKK